MMIRKGRNNSGLTGAELDSEGNVEQYTEAALGQCFVARCCRNVEICQRFSPEFNFAATYSVAALGRVRRTRWSKPAKQPKARAREKHGARAFHLQWMLVARDLATTKLLLPSSAAVVMLEGILPGPSFHGLVIAGATDRRVLLLPRREDCRTDQRLRVPGA
jgi:hypothetical protein